MTLFDCVFSAAGMSWLRIFSQLKGTSIRSPCNLASWAIIFVSGTEGSVLSRRASTLRQSSACNTGEDNTGQEINILHHTLGSVIFILLFPSLTISWLTPSPHWNFCLGLVARWCVREGVESRLESTPPAGAPGCSAKHRQATQFTGLSHTCSGSGSLLSKLAAALGRVAVLPCFYSLSDVSGCKSQFQTISWKAATAPPLVKVQGSACEVRKGSWETGECNSRWAKELLLTHFLVITSDMVLNATPGRSSRVDAS